MRYAVLLLLLGCDSPERAEVVCVRGWLWLGSGGMGDLAAEARDLGFTAADVPHTRSWKPSGPQVLIGHSFGADRVMQVVSANADVRFPLVVTVDCTAQWTKPKNVDWLISIRGSEPWCHVEGADRIYTIGVNHLLIDKSPFVHLMALTRLVQLSPRGR